MDIQRDLHGPKKLPRVDLPLQNRDEIEEPSRDAGTPEVDVSSSSNGDRPAKKFDLVRFFSMHFAAIETKLGTLESHFFSPDSGPSDREDQETEILLSEPLNCGDDVGDSGSDGVHVFKHDSANNEYFSEAPGIGGSETSFDEEALPALEGITLAAILVILSWFGTSFGRPTARLNEMPPRTNRVAMVAGPMLNDEVRGNALLSIYVLGVLKMLSAGTASEPTSPASKAESSAARAE